MLIVLVAFSCVQSENANSETVNLSGPYLGQELPDTTPRIFAPGIISTNLHEDGAPCFTPNGNNIYWRVYGKQQSKLLYIELKDNVWSSPRMSNFQGNYSTGRMFISPNGEKLFFSTNRPTNIGDEPMKTYDFWMANSKGDAWDKPVRLPETINSEYNELDISISNKGTIFFNRQGSPENDFDILYSEFINGEFSEPQSIGEPINTEFAEAAPYIAPDESYLIFTSDRPGGYGQTDLWISFKSADDTWTDPINLGDKINSEYMDKFTSVSTDKKFLFFVSSRPRVYYEELKKEEKVYNDTIDLYKFYSTSKSKPFYCDVYWVSAKIISELKPF